MLHYWFFFYALFFVVFSNAIGTIDFNHPTKFITNYSMVQNYVGLAIEIQHLLPLLQNVTLIKLIQYSRCYHNWNNNFNLHVFPSPGYRYNCDLSNLQCKFDFNNITFLTIIGNFTFTCLNINGLYFSWQDTALNYSDFNVLINYQKFFNDIINFSNQPCVTVIITEGDLIQNYSFDSYYSDAQSVQYFFTPQNNYYSGPGWTDNATIDQMNIVNFSNFFTKGLFQIQAIIFNQTNLTIETLLKKNNTQYFARRFMATDFKDLLKLVQKIYICKLQIIAGNGIDGVTNTFAAALWFLDFAMESTLLNIYEINVFTSLKENDFKGVFSANLTPRPIYYAMLLISIITDFNGSLVMSPLQFVSQPANIKVYGLYNQQKFAFVIINKDMNETLTSKINIKIPNDPKLIKCIQLKAPTLNATGNVTIGKMYFKNDKMQGIYKNKIYTLNDTYFNVQILYAQALYCYTANSTINTSFNRRINRNIQYLLQFSLIFMIFICY